MDLAMPRLSDTMEEGTLGRWLKHEGESIEKGEVIAEIQTDKANMELEAFQGGVLERILVQEGETVAIGEAIAVIGDGSGQRAETDAQAPAEQPKQQENARADGKQARQAEAAPQRASAQTGPTGRIKASPLARRIAQEHDIDLAAVKGTGPNGRITRDDVEQAARSATPAAPPTEQVPAQAQAVEPQAAPVAAGEVQPFTRVQSIVARRMVESKTQAPHIYITLEVDMAKASKLREDVNALGGQKVSVNDLVIKACAAALRAYPKANASFAESGIRHNTAVNVGFAVSQEDGLVVPVVRDADQKSLRQIATETRKLIGKSRENRLSGQDITGGTFTVSNLGMYGVDEFQAIINQPECAILAVGAVVQKPVVQDDQIVIGHRMRVTLSADHRVLYGVDAAEFLREVQRLLEEPLNLGF
jgi:pyruvate dehydrogenase E2 component (dihydrolipoamide acetyltransferase)